jgi:hypothetical protein
MAQVVNYQEETLLGMVSHKDMLRWSEREHKALAQIEYIKEIQKGRGEEEHGIRVLTDDNIEIIQRVVEYWTQEVVEPQQNMQEMWEECLKNWEKINEKMRDIQFPEFGSPENFHRPQ